MSLKVLILKPNRNDTGYQDTRFMAARRLRQVCSDCAASALLLHPDEAEQAASVTPELPLPAQTFLVPESNDIPTSDLWDQFEVPFCIAPQLQRSFRIANTASPAPPGQQLAKAAARPPF